MQSSRRHGREFLLNRLPDIDGPSRDAIIRHIFERNDRVSMSAVNTKPLSEESKKQLTLNCGSWAAHAKQLLDHLVEDIGLALKITHWDRNILEDVLALIGFLKNCGGAREDLVSSCSKHGKKKITIRGGSEKLYSELGQDLNVSLQSVNDAFTQLVTHLKSKNSNVRDGVDDLVHNSGDGKRAKIPTATLRELFIFNEACGKGKEIWHHVDRMLHLAEAEKGSTREGEEAAGGDGEAAYPLTDITDIVGMLACLCFPSNQWLI